MNKILSFFFVLCTAAITAQPVLHPHIGLNSEPQPSDPICTIPVYTGDFYTSGLAEGDTVPDFTLYKTNGDSVRLSDVLSNGNPVLLVAGNYTCPVFREKIADLNAMTSFYSGQLEVFVVYGVEAHPVVDPSPYSGNVWTTSDNYNEGVLFEQPETYGERLALIDSMLLNYTILPEILVDGPCNPWWSVYGPAPNNAYLINTNGIITSKQGWFHRAPDNMWCEIDSLLGTNSGNCFIAGSGGAFAVTLDSPDSTDYGNTGDVLEIHMTITNLSSTENVELNVSKYLVNIPAGWQSALCLDICYTTSVSSANITIPAGDSQPFTFYFYTNSVADTGFAKIGFVNLNDSSNYFFQNVRGITSDPAAVDELEKLSFRLFPNPAAEYLNIESSGLSEEEYKLYDAYGRIVKTGIIGPGFTSVYVGDLHPGIYIMTLNNEARQKIILN